MVLERYVATLRNLLPVGFAWPRQRETNMENFLTACAGELERVDGRARDLLTEVYPLTSSELLTDWERVTGLPEACEGLAETVQRRRQAVDNKLATIGGQSPGYYIDLAARLGYEITITEFSPFVAGDDAGDPLYGDDWGHAWQVNGDLYTIQYFNAGEGSAGDPLASWGNELLECVISRLAPAHTVVLFAYT